jgi:hypothetical protein
MLSLDASGVLSEDDGGRTVPLGERIPDRSVDVRSFSCVSGSRKQHSNYGKTAQTEAKSSRTAPRQSRIPPLHQRRLRLVPPEASITDTAKMVEQTRLSRKAA